MFCNGWRGGDDGCGIGGGGNGRGGGIGNLDGTGCQEDQALGHIPTSRRNAKNVKCMVDLSKLGAEAHVPTMFDVTVIDNCSMFGTAGEGR